MSLELIVWFNIFLHKLQNACLNMNLIILVKQLNFNMYIYACFNILKKIERNLFGGLWLIGDGLNTKNCLGLESYFAENFRFDICGNNVICCVIEGMFWREREGERSHCFLYQVSIHLLFYLCWRLDTILLLTISSYGSMIGELALMLKLLMLYVSVSLTWVLCDEDKLLIHT